MTERSFSLAGEVEKGFRRMCGIILKRAYDAVLAADDFESSWDEDEFTAEMVKHMDEINEGDFHYPLRITWDEKGKTGNNLDSDDHPNRAQRVDITLDRVSHSGTKEYSIECKRVRIDDTGLFRKYWKQGVRRYVDAEYADKYSFGAMAAYVLKGGIDENAEELRIRCENYRDRMQLKRRWEFQYSTEGMDVYLTKHGRDGLEDIQLDHHLLDFT